MWPNSITSFLHELGGTVALSYFRPDKGPFDQQLLSAWRLDEAEPRYRAFSEPVNAYYMLNEPRDGLKAKPKFGKGDVGGLRGCHCDIDGDVQEILRRFEGAPEPTGIVLSGGGVQPLYLLNQAINAASGHVARIEALNQALIARFSGDPPTWNIDRILRLPFTVNHPDAKKRERGRVPVLAMIEAWSGIRYELGELEAQFKPRARPRSADRGQAEGGDFSDSYGAELAAELKARLDAEIERFPDFARMWAGDRPEGDLSGSGHLAALAFQMRRAGFTDQEFAATAHAWKLCHGANRDKNLSARSLGRAWDNAGAKLDEPEHYENGHDYEPDWAAPDPEPGEPPRGASTNNTDYQADSGDLGLVTIEQYRLRDEATIPQRPWVVRGLLLKGHLTSLFASGGVGKSIFGLTIAEHVAVGRSFGNYKIPAPARVAFLSVEEDPDEIDRRHVAISMTFNITQAELDGRLFKISILKSQLLAMVVNPKTQKIEPTPRFWELVGKLKQQEIEALILDPFIELWEGEENNSMQMKAVAALFRDRLARDLDLAVLLIHHVKKGTVEPGDADAGRGSSSLSNTSRLVNTMTRMTKEQAGVLGVDEHRDKVRVDRGKNSYGANIEEAHWFRWITYTIANGPPGDDVGIIKPWQPPGMFSGVEFKDINRLLDRITAGLGEGERYTTSHNSGPRYVVPLIADELDVEPGRAKLILKTWLNSRLLREIEYHSEKQRKMRKGLMVDDAKRPEAGEFNYE